MGNFIVAALLIFFISAIIAAIVNKKKEKEWERNLPENVRKTKKLYKGSLNLYKDKAQNKTILRYFVSRKVFELADFLPSSELLLKEYLFLFDQKQKVLTIVDGITTHKSLKTIPFNDLISLEPVVVSKSKIVTRGGITPFEIGGYRMASITKKRLREISKAYVDITYKSKYGKGVYSVTLFDGSVTTETKRYESIYDDIELFISTLCNRISQNLATDVTEKVRV